MPMAINTSTGMSRDTDFRYQRAPNGQYNSHSSQPKYSSASCTEAPLYLQHRMLLRCAEAPVHFCSEALG